MLNIYLYIFYIGEFNSDYITVWTAPISSVKSTIHGGIVASVLSTPKDIWGFGIFYYFAPAKMAPPPHFKV